MNKTDEFLEHYGIKGMKWGVRRPRGPDGRVKGGTMSSDAKKADKALGKVKKSGVKSLTNNELQGLNRRLQLEQQFSQLSAGKNTKKTKKGREFLKSALSVGNDVNQAIAFVNSPAGRMVRDAVVKK